VSDRIRVDTADRVGINAFMERRQPAFVGR
jgi:hypothetical protein